MQAHATATPEPTQESTSATAGTTRLNDKDFGTRVLEHPAFKDTPAPAYARKRTGGTEQRFDIHKIEDAIRKAWVEVQGDADTRKVAQIALFATKMLDTPVVTVEQIQDAVEVALMKFREYAVAKAYILYRAKRQELRQARLTPDPRAVSDYIHLSKYARYLPDAQRRELYAETVTRVREMHRRKFAHVPGLDADICWAFDRVLEKRVLPSMRSMQFGGPAVEAINNRIYNCLGVETEFITVDGVRKFSDFKDGESTTVLTHTGAWKPAVVRQYGEQQLFKVAVGRGRSAHTVRATRDHTWILESGARTCTLAPKDKLAKAPRVVGAWEYADSSPTQRMYWAMGYVYGDGTCVKGRDGAYRWSMVRLCGADKARFLDRFKELGFAWSAPASCGGDAIAYTGRYLKTLPTIKEDGVENVTAFVRGFLDADGCKNPNGDWPSPFNSIQVSGGEAIDFVRRVFPAVGAYITREDDLTGEETNYGVRPETVRFGLVLGFGDAAASPYSIQSIEPDAVETVWCLDVEDDHSFVLPNGIVTGNCTFSFIDRPRAFAEAMFLLLCGSGVGYSVQFEHVEKLPALAYVDEDRVVHHTVADSIEGWADALDALITSYIQGYSVEFNYAQVRAKGSTLKLSGGKAPGHRKLKASLERIRAILHGAQGRKLRPIECHDMMCHAADAVLSGGIRRSAMICLFSLDDSEMVYAKTGTWWQHHPWRQNANNSVMLKRDEATRKQFHRIIQMTKEWGEPGFYFCNDFDYGTNPCVPAGTRVLTRDGYAPIEGLVGTEVEVWNGREWSTVTPRITGYSQPIVRVHLSDGTALACTDYHEWCLAGGGRVKAIELVPGDNLEKFAMPVVEGGADMPDAYARGSSNSTEVPHAASVTSRLEWLAGVFDAGCGADATGLRLIHLNDHFLCEVRLMLTTLGVQAEVTFSDSWQACVLRINAADVRTLVAHGLRPRRLDLAAVTSSTQRDAHRFISVTRIERLPAAAVVYCFTEAKNHTGTFEGVVTGQCAEIGMNPKLVITEDILQLLAQRAAHGKALPDVKLGDTVTGWAFCNLCEINAAMFKSAEDFEVAAKAATIIGTLQAAYTDMAYLGWPSEVIAEREALLGIGMTGMLDAPHIACDAALQRGIAAKVNRWNAEYAAKIGVRPAARTTCIKPSGTTSLELGCVGSGHHAHHARRYIRRVTADELETVFQHFRAANPHMCVKKPDGKWVIEFPVEAPADAIIKEDVDALAFLAMVRSTQQNWVVPGTVDASVSPGLTHNVSNTVHVKPDEWDAVEAYIWDHRDAFTGVSLIAATADKQYAFAPNEAVVTEADEARYNQLIANYVPVDYAALLEAEDGTSLMGEQACAGGACEVKF